MIAGLTDQARWCPRNPCEQHSASAKLGVAEVTKWAFWPLHSTETSSNQGLIMLGLLTMTAHWREVNYWTGASRDALPRPRHAFVAVDRSMLAC